MRRAALALSHAAPSTFAGEPLNHLDGATKLGYVALVADIYGDEVPPANTGVAGKLAGAFKGTVPSTGAASPPIRNPPIAAAGTT